MDERKEAPVMLQRQTTTRFPTRTDKTKGEVVIPIQNSQPVQHRPSSIFQPSYIHRLYNYKNEDILVVDQLDDVAEMMKLRVKRDNEVTRHLTVTTAQGCGDALVRIINGKLTYAVILCPYEPTFVQWARQNGYPGVIVSLDPYTPVEHVIRDGFDAGIRKLDIDAMQGLARLFRDVIKPDQDLIPSTDVAVESDASSSDTAEDEP